MGKVTKTQLLMAAITLVVLVGLVFAIVQLTSSDDQVDQPGSNVATNQPTNPNAVDDNEAAITKEKAEQIAIDKFGGSAKETESDSYQGQPAWEVELSDSKHGRIEVKVDKQTGEILHYEQD